ncbi:hypothetical protein B0T17DRAFT_616423 [Bombardia bombarda]|uniref:DUF5672 domain-containing protein n=1 Tax=Bombardia bombarda TaxID=252184 RepID=A0AA40C9V5_9PEZI|nr:hypothetical protein B0T17DRAFT_616423 [Bombardia bombarda]
MAAWGRTSRRMRMAGGVVLFLTLSIWLSSAALHSAGLAIPTLSLEYHYRQQASRFNESKVALLIENRSSPILAPLMLHFMSVVPPDWRFRFMGSDESVAHINKSVAIREHVAAGKLDLTYIPSNMTTGSQEEISRFLTNLWLYETVLQPAEHLLIFQTDSMLCANSKQSLNDYLEYDWVGAPWRTDSVYGGNGGLSLRRVSAIIDVLRNQQRIPGSDAEDLWLTERLGHRHGAKMANGTISLAFSGEQYAGDKVRLNGTGISTGATDTTTAAAAPVSGKAWNQTTISTTATTIAQNTDDDDEDDDEAAAALAAALEAARKGSYVKGLDDWRGGFYEPMGYHTGGSGKYLHSANWGTPELRKHIWDYCPEIKMTLQMDVAKYLPGSCGAVWKRGDGSDGFAEEEDEDYYETEMIDGVEYPVLRGVVPW